VSITMHLVPGNFHAGRGLEPSLIVITDGTAGPPDQGLSVPAEYGTSSLSQYMKSVLA